MEGRSLRCGFGKLRWVRAGVYVGCFAMCVLAAVGSAAAEPASPVNATANTQSLAIDEASSDQPVTASEQDRLNKLAQKLASQAAAETQQASEHADSPSSARSRNASAGPIAAIERTPLGSPAVSADRPGQQSTAPYSYEGGDSWVLTTLGSLGVVLGLILLLKWGWSRVGGMPTASASPVVEVLSRTPVAPRNHVLLLRVGGRILVVGDSPAGMQPLSEVDDPDEIANLLTAVTAARDNSISKNFASLLNRFHGDYENSPRNVTEEGADDNEFVYDRTRDNVSGLLSRIRNMSSKGGGRA